MAFASRSAPTEVFANQMDENSMPEDRGSGGTRGNQGHKRNLSKEISKERRASGGRTRRSDMGRAEWSRSSVDKRARNDTTQQAARRRKLNNEEGHVPVYAAHFSKEEIENEEKKPKRKVAVMIGNHHEKTIEGDLFSAFVAAGAISKANGDDPKKSSLTRCARTDKGVHAAGNLISAKLIIDDPDIVRKINENLTPQIRVFSIQRTNGSFSAYQFCDSRIYEYLIPTHAFLPPHPSSFLGKKLVELAEEADDLERYQSRQREVSTFWEETEERYVKPVLEQLDPSIRSIVFNALYELEANHFHVDKSDSLDRTGSENPIFQHSKIDSGVGLATDGPIQQPSTSKVEDSDQQSIRAEIVDPAQHSANLKEYVIQDQGDTSDQIEDPAQDSTSLKEVGVIQTYQRDTSDQLADPAQHSAGIKEDATQNQRDISDQLEDPAQHSANLTEDATQEKKATFDQLEDPSPKTTDPSPLDVAIKKLRAEYMAAKKAYRIHPDRLARVRSALSLFLGSQNYHNYTVHKDFRDSSAKRVIKSFVVHDQPVLINGTEWLSLKVHGQSFMMHQIRKMVSMVALVVRCGCHEGRLQDSFMKENMSIPKAPGLGLLLERPVFDTYNERLVGQYGREKIDFGKFQVVMEEFKQREIYERIFREEERDNQFHTFFSSIDNFKSPQFLYLSSVGPPATRRPLPAAETSKADLMANDVINGALSDEEIAGEEDGEDG